MLSPQERSLRARAAAYARASQYDGRTVTAAARAGRWAKLLASVAPDGSLSEAALEDTGLRAGGVTPRVNLAGRAYLSARPAPTATPRVSKPSSARAASSARAGRTGTVGRPGAATR